MTPRHFPIPDGAESAWIAHARRLFGFTSAEVALALLLTNGLTLDEAATELNIRKNTARAHLRSIFSKTGAAAMAGLGALRAGAGLVTVASAASAIPVIASHAPELMTAPLEELDQLVEGKTVIAMGPGLGLEIGSRVARTLDQFPHPMVLDADASAVAYDVTLRDAGRPNLRPAVTGDDQPLNVVPVEMKIPFMKRCVFEIHVIVARQAENRGFLFHCDDIFQDLVFLLEDATGIRGFFPTASSIQIAPGKPANWR